MSEAVQLKPLDIEIEVLSGPHRGQRFSFAAQEVITIGRDPENDVGLVNDPRVSRFHAEIKYSEGSFYIHNKSDKNYILINGIKDEQALIGSKSNITIGETEIKVIIPDLKPSPTPVLFDNKAVTNESQIIGFKSPLKPLPSNPLEMPMIHPNTPSYPTNYVPASVGAPQVANTGNKKRKKIKKPKKDNNLLIYVFGIIAIALIYLMIPKKVEQPSKKTPIITPVLEDEARLKRSEDELEKARERMRNMDSRKQMARQFFVSGMREYNNGQYQKAIEYLSSAFQSDPSLEDAAKYRMKAKQNLDRLIDFNFSEGKKYREGNNYRMCKASFQTVLFYIKNDIKHPRYVEAKQYYDECSSLDEIGRL